MFDRAMRLVAGAVVVLAVAGTFGGASAARAEVTFAVSGTVADARTGLPVAGAVVIADQRESATTDEGGRYTLRLMPSSLLHSLSVRATLYYIPPRPTEVLVTDSDVAGVDIQLSRDRATIVGPRMESIEVDAVPGETVTVDLSGYVTVGTYPLSFVEFGFPNIGATVPGGRIALDHWKKLRVGTISFSGTTLTFAAARANPGGTATVSVLALDPYNFGSGTVVIVTVTEARSATACAAAKATLAKARKAQAKAAVIRKAKAAVAAACSPAG